MKLRSLFLAGLAAMAMVSCSNEDDQIIDNGGVKLEENARMQFSIAFPTANSTRALDENDANGLTTEQNVKSIQLILKYEDNSLTSWKCIHTKGF